MQAAESYVNERLDHLGIVAEVCEESGIAAYLDRLAGETKHHVSMGTATVAMILHGLGFSNRRLYLVPQFFANKPVGHLLGPGIQAADLADDCLGRALDWLYAHDPTQLFAGIATQARKIFGVSARQVHVDTTSFAVKRVLSWLPLSWTRASSSSQEVVSTYKDQGGVERGFRFLKDPLFLASSVFLKKPERIAALGLIMVLCLLVYRLAEYRLRTHLAETEQTVPNQLNRPTPRPTMRWIFQCFEGIELLHIHAASGMQSLILRLQPMHRLVLALLGPLYEKIYTISS